MEKIEDLKPLNVGHENSKLYAMLKECMRNNAELRRQIEEDQQQMLDAAETIEKLTRELYK
jgi:hypothetical protein